MIPSGSLVGIKAAGRQTGMSSHGVQHTFWPFPWPYFFPKPLEVNKVCVILSAFQADRQLWHHQSQTSLVTCAELKSRAHSRA